jgi:hypothetical protein
MQRFFMEAGPLIIPIVLLAGVIAMLTLWNLIAVLSGAGENSQRRRRSIDSILFWGAFAAILGFLGQWIGIHRLSQVVAERGIVNPQMVAYGLSESLLTPIAGMMVLVIAGFIWFALRLGLWRQEERA